MTEAKRNLTGAFAMDARWASSLAPARVMVTSVVLYALACSSLMKTADK